jgi:hypothetical protein
MNENIARLRARERNIDRYQRLLKTKLNDAETQFVERRLAEERFWLTMLAGSFRAPLKSHDSGRAPE